MSEDPLFDERVGRTWFGIGILGLIVAFVSLGVGLFLVVRLILELAD